ncbi:MAG: REP-associated tyrosine transposase [Pseudomonadota bacterium]
MVLYRRNHVPGGTYFFTLTLRNRSSRILVEEIGALRWSLRKIKAERPFEILAMVVLPDHLHAVWRLPDGDDRYATRIQILKFRFTEALKAKGIPLPRYANGERALWARRFWEHTIRDEEDLRAHVDYVHYNPVKHGVVDHVSAWPYSTFHRDVAAGRTGRDWGSMPASGMPGDR